MNKEDNLSQEEIQLFKELIYQCDLKKQNKVGLTPLMVALIYNKTQNLKLTKTQFKEMYNALNEDQQQITFQNIIQENF